MADKAISELIAAEQITATDMFVLEQNGTAKRLTGQVLLNWLTKAADGHGGISGISQIATSGLSATYRITLADTTTFDFVVNDGKGIKTVNKTGASGLVDTYTITYTDGTTDTFKITNGAKGDKGDNTYLWIKYASQQPTEASHSFGDIADAWIGIYFGSLASAPADWKQYQWYQIKGDKGDTGAPATVTNSTVEYQVSSLGSVIPSGEWSMDIPLVAQGKYLWTRQTVQFNSGAPVVSYSVARAGVDGSGSVSSINSINPDENGNVSLSAEQVGAMAADKIIAILNADVIFENGVGFYYHSAIKASSVCFVQRRINAAGAEYQMVLGTSSYEGYVRIPLNQIEATGLINMNIIIVNG